MTVKDIETRILESFSDCKVMAVDLTQAGSNFEIRLSTPDLKDLTRVERHQTVLNLFKTEFASGTLHALSIKYLP